MICKTHFKLKKNGEPCSTCFCRHPELIENYAKTIADETQVWECHHRREELYSMKELVERGEYFDVPPEDLIFLTKAEHHKMDSMCKRVSEAMKCKKRKNHTKETKIKIGKALSKKVLCIETGEVFDSTMDAYRKTGISHSGISQVCNGSRNVAGGYHWKFL